MSKPRISFLSENEIEAIHNASLKVLGNTGIKVMSQQALDILKEAGAKVDYDGNRATIPANLVEEALRRAPKTIKYYARNPKYDFVLNKQEPHLCTVGGLHIVDGETGEHRSATKEDIARCAVIGDYLDHVDVVWRVGTPMDVPAAMQNMIGMYICLSNTEKHVEGGMVNAKEAQYTIEIAAAIVGGREELKRRPIISATECPISPLTYDKGMIEAVIEFAKAGVPVVMYSMPMMGATGPATLAGTMAIANAEFLGGLVILEFASPGTPVVYAIDVSSMDFKTGAVLSQSAENSLMNVGLGQLAYRYGLPTEKEASCGDSRVLDARAGFSVAIALIACILTAPDIILGVGGLKDGTCPEAMVFGNDIMDYALRFTQGFEVNDDALATDIIDKVGPGGNFLGEKHTLEHFRERWIPRMSVIDTFETWQKKGSKSIAEVAKEKTGEILATHKPEPIPEGAEEEISQILKRAEVELLKIR